MTSSSDRRGPPRGPAPLVPTGDTPPGPAAPVPGAAPGPAAAPSPAAAHARSLYSRFIPREEIGGFAAWQPGAIGAPEPAAAPPPPDPAALARREAERQREQVHAARQAGYQEGYRDGLAALEGFKQHYAAQVTGQVAAIAHSYGARLDDLEKHLAERITGVVLELARQAVRTELALQPRHIVAVAAEALGVLLMSARHVTLRLHPDDQALVAEGCAEALAARHARLVADPAIERGGCRVESDIGVVDAQVSTRWLRAAQSLGDDGGWT